MMKAAFAVTLLLNLLGLTHAVDYEVATCEELVDIDDTTVTSLTITSSPFVCDTYTRYRVRNDMVLTSTLPEVKFFNFCLKVLGALTVEVDVSFADVSEEVVNGGALYVDEGSTATFKGDAYFNNTSTMEKTLPPTVLNNGGFIFNYVPKKGGAIHNKGDLVFEKDAIFERNSVLTDDSTNSNKGGAISNTARATIHFMGQLTMRLCDAEGFFEGRGGCIYNRGDIVVDGESLFEDSEAGGGGAIVQERWASFIFNDVATFQRNTCFEFFGGQIANFGAKMTFNAGSYFIDGVASSSGDGGGGGAILNLGPVELTFNGKTVFEGNSAYLGGAIYNEDDESGRVPQVTYPDDAADLVFNMNTAEFCNNVYSSGECEFE